MNDAVIGQAHAEDSSGIVAVIRSGFAPEILGATVYACHGIARFIEAQIGVPTSVADTTWTVAAPASKGSGSTQAIGCVELRRFPSALFLNYISVLPAFRGAGLGRKLLHAAIVAGRQNEQREMLLDVFTEDELANRWYDRLGFEDQERSEWWDLGPCSAFSRTAADQGNRSGFIAEFPQASVSQREFGFSQFKVTTSDGTSTIGRLGEKWFRLTRSQALGDPALVAVLTTLDPGRHVLAILPAGTLPRAAKDRARLIGYMVRKRAGMEQVVERLHE
jgi:GNAT superfamily N-acetyltransferase